MCVGGGLPRARVPVQPPALCCKESYGVDVRSTKTWPKKYARTVKVAWRARRGVESRRGIAACSSHLMRDHTRAATARGGGLDPAWWHEDRRWSVVWAGDCALEIAAGRRDVGVALGVDPTNSGNALQACVPHTQVCRHARHTRGRPVELLVVGLCVWWGGARGSTRQRPLGLEVSFCSNS